MRLFFTLCLIFLANVFIQAQIQQAVLGHNPQIEAVKKQPYKKAISRSQKGAALPFFDDFSYEGPFPDVNTWTDNHVFINNTLAYQPLSIGVATFDGLDATGSPYGGSGSSDTLTSISLDLSGNASKYISYYIQPKGLGDAPGPEDKLILEFKNAAGEWIEVASHEVTLEESLFPQDSLPNFQFIGPIEIGDTPFLHDDFQFRFRNFALRTGAADLWHLDYVRLETEQPLQNTGDLAFTQLPSNILLNYSSAPWIHLREEITNNPELVLINVDINVNNHSIVTIGTDDSELLVNGIDGNEVLPFRRQPLLVQERIASGRHLFTNPIRGEYRSAYRNEFKSSDKIQISVNYSFEQSNSEPEPTQRNNKVSRTFDLDNYYSYDDNSAESALFIGTGGQVAVRFTNYKADLLQAIRMQIPRIVGADISQSSFTLKVWLDLNSDPIYEAPFTKPLFIDEFRDSLQAFTTYLLKDQVTGELMPIELPVGDFYIGWHQVTSCGNTTCLPVGFDRNTPTATENIYLNPEGSWGQIADFFGGVVPVSQTGALMIRPVVGSEPPKGSESVVATSEIVVPQIMNIFPNPSTGIINFQLKEGNYQTYQINVFNSLGQSVKQETLSPQLNLSNQLPGIYFLQFVNIETQVIGNYKLILNR